MTERRVFSLIPTHMHTTGQPTAAKAMADIVGGVKHASLWLSLAWHEIKLRYRGSILGPFWLSLSMGATVVALGLVYGALFKMDLNKYMPYLVAGLIGWNYISMLLGDACICFTQSEAFIKKIRQPFSIYVYRTIWKNLIIFAHNFLIYVVVAIIFGIWPGWHALWLIPALALIILNSIWICFLLGMICARFRDVTQIVMSITQIVFFVTPVLWHTESLSGRGYLVKFNPFYHALEILRAPMLGQDPSLANWMVASGLAVGGLTVAFFFFRRFRARLAYWI